MRFFVDNVLLGEAKKGPPWGIDWTDDNPFEPREIRAEVVDSNGHTAKDSVLLKPLEVLEHAQVSSVYVETSVQDKAGRFVTGMGPSAFQLFEDDVPQTLDVVRPEQLPATFTILIDTSQSMSRRIDFVRFPAARLASYLGKRIASSSHRSPRSFRRSPARRTIARQCPTPSPRFVRAGGRQSSTRSSRRRSFCRASKEGTPSSC